MPKNCGQQSMSIHRKVRVSDANKKSVASRGMVGNDMIRHFAPSPIPEEEVVLDDIEEITKEQELIEKDTNQDKPIETRNASAKQIKEQEIEKAFKVANHRAVKPKKNMRKRPPAEFAFKKIALAFVCTVLIVVGIAYLVDANSPDISMKVAAMQNGIDAIYPKYIPRGYGESPTDITSENGKITMNYKNVENGNSFSIIEEYSEWTNEEFYDNYVVENFGNDYTKVENSGLTIYIHGNSIAVWIDGNVMMRLEVNSGSLTKKQITTIATTK